MQSPSTGMTPPRLFPFCIVWTPIPPITWLLPFVGHLGICRSDGTILDFMGPFTVQVDNFGFGRPARYLRLNPASSHAYSPSDSTPIEMWWDDALDHSAAFFRTLIYNFCGTNCHSFVAFYLNQIGYDHSVRWNTVCLVIEMFFKSRHVDSISAMKIWIPFCALSILGVYFGRWMFLYGFLGLVGAVLFYFLLYEYACQAQTRLIDKFGQFNANRHGV